ncbi:immunoglobulin-like domain-containing protein [Microbacterium aurantiacum]|uniref:Ig-like domain-containing protein n=1 Tax=Microbacterium aurantiacum TaxID=162393 RepID=A0ABT8FUD6_9MICO|nr:immunoglobulin-like domain-containing protein [Microbacterium aurantiacum]MDN4464805.1 Ig-like domain-containing protein [Microbacterium aurantiacum]
MTRTRRLKRTSMLAAAGTLLAALVVPVSGAHADVGSDPIIHYTFDAASGGVVSDVSGNGNDATLRQSGGEVRDGILSLPGGSRSTSAYLEIPTADLVGQKDLTISTWLSPRSGPGNVAAAFIGAPVAQGASFSSGYWLLNPSNPNGYVKSVITNAVNAGAPWSTEIGAGSTAAPSSGVRTPQGMNLYTTVIDGTSGQLRSYLNGQPVVTSTIARDVSSFGSQVVAYLARSTYNDPHWAGDVDDFAVYGSAMSATDVAAMYQSEAVDRAVAAVSVPERAEADFTVPTTSYGIAVAWASDDAAVAISGGTATVTRPVAGASDAQVTLTATFGSGPDAPTRTYTVTVPAELSDQEKVDADLAELSIAQPDDIRTNFSVSTRGALGSTISWNVAEGDAYAALRTGVRDTATTVEVSRPAAGSDAAEVVLVATATSGSASSTREFRVRVQPMPAAGGANEAYVWAFFTGEGAGAEQISLAASRGNDALAWNTLNDGEPLFSSTLGTQGLRDPFIIRSPEGDRFYMLATDLKIDGLPGGFRTAQISGSTHIEVWESNDLVNWSEQRHVKVSSDFAGNTWAPEAYWDEDLDTYVVFWASNMYPTANPADRSDVTYNQMMYATTDDFVTFSEAKPWINVRRGNGLGMIDSTVAQIGDTYYRFTKDEASMTIRLEKSTNLTASVSGSLPGTTGAADQWTLIKERVASGLPNGEPGGTYNQGEGPSIFPSNPGDVNGFDWFLFIDQPSYHGGPNYYIPFGSDDLADGDSWQPLGAKLRANLPQNSDGGKPRHGTIIPVTRAEYQKVLEEYAPDIAVASVDAIAVETEAGTAPVLPQATLNKADGSTETVAVEWDGIDAADYAEAGTFTVRGVAQDASRMPVEATVTVTASAPIEVTVATRCLAGKVLVSATLRNVSDAAATAQVSTAFGSRTVTVAPGKAASYAFTARQAAIPAGEVLVTVEGKTTATSYAAFSCTTPR